MCFFYALTARGRTHHDCQENANTIVPTSPKCWVVESSFSRGTSRDVPTRSVRHPGALPTVSPTAVSATSTHLADHRKHALKPHYGLGSLKLFDKSARSAKANLLPRREPMRRRMWSPPSAPTWPATGDHWLTTGMFIIQEIIEIAMES